MYLDRNVKRIFAIAFLGENRFSYGNFRISRITDFKNRSFSSGQGLVQIKPKSV